LYSTGDRVFNFTGGTVHDSNGIYSITYTRSKDNAAHTDGTGTIVITPVDSQNSTWSLTETQPDEVASTGSYEYIFTVTDNAGKTETCTRRISLDYTNPEVKITSITPQLSADGRSNNVNGTITVKGTITDNNSVSSGTYALAYGDTSSGPWTSRLIQQRSPIQLPRISIYKYP
jgi:hypothetical protein